MANHSELELKVGCADAKLVPSAMCWVAWLIGDPCYRIGFTRNMKCRGTGKLYTPAALFAYLGNGEVTANNCICSRKGLFLICLCHPWDAIQHEPGRS